MKLSRGLSSPTARSPVSCRTCMPVSLPVQGWGRKESKEEWGKKGGQDIPLSHRNLLIPCVLAVTSRSNAWRGVESKKKKGKVEKRDTYQEWRARHICLPHPRKWGLWWAVSCRQYVFMRLGRVFESEGVVRGSGERGIKREAGDIPAQVNAPRFSTSSTPIGGLQDHLHGGNVSPCVPEYCRGSIEEWSE